MAAKTCLLCGKSLSRIWAGTGEDFCSREHRNQYRLRRGMDRLLEANKVANVIRRREMPRQIPVEQLRAAGDENPRGFLEARRLEANPAEFRIPESRPAQTATLAGRSEFLRPVSDCEVEPIALPGPSITSQAAPAFPPARAAVLWSEVAPAPPVAAGAKVARIETRRRAAVTPRSKRAPVPKQTALAPPHSTAAYGAPPRKLFAPAAGRALRVSLSAGFRAPGWQLRATGLEHAPIAGMQWPGVRPIDTTAPMSPRQPFASAIAPGEPEMRLPAGPRPDFGARFRWPGAIAVSIEFVNAADGHRSAFVPFGSPDEAAKERR